MTTWGVDSDDEGREPARRLRLSRPGRRLDIDAEDWAGVLQLIAEWAWFSDRPPGAFTARGVEVSAEEAGHLAETGDRVLRGALRERRAPPYVEILLKVVEFLEGGAFRVDALPRKGPPKRAGRGRRRAPEGSD